MRVRQRVVVDTNAFVSRLLLPSSVVASAVRKALDSDVVLVSEATISELSHVLGRSKFDRYVSLSERERFLRLLMDSAESIPTTTVVRACRDPKDDKFLEVAINGDADLIVTGDKDLLALHPFRRIPILSPTDYLLR